MKTMKKLLSIVLATLMIFSCVSVSLTANAAGADRYSVLVLDVSGSMGDAPIAHLKVAAKKFCDTVLNNLGSSNEVAIVAFASSAKVVCNFTNDLTALNSAIDSLNAYGTTNLADGLVKANDLLSKVDDNSIKNVLVMCDGWPDDEPAAYSVADSMFAKNWNVYGLYFCPYGSDSYAANVMQKVGKTAYIEVQNADELEYFFEEIAGEFTENDFNKTVLRVACPVDVSVTLYGETLDKNNKSTSFGKFSYEDANKEIKIIELNKYSKNYEVKIVGTGDGTMDYSASFYKDDTLVSSQTYPTVTINPKTIIEASVDASSAQALQVDDNGDGTVDRTVAANGSGNIFEVLILFFVTIIEYLIALVASFF